MPPPDVPPTDLVVVLPGIMGSTLRHRGHLVWSPSAGSALRAIATFGRSLRDLTLPEDLGDAHPGDGVEPVALMPDLHLLPGLWTPVRGYDPLLARLRALGYREAAPGDPDAPPGNLLPVPYDWRLSNRCTGAWLKTIVEPALERWRAQGGAYADAQLVFVCHSMGGLVARWYVEREGGAGHTRKVITLGTPYRGAARALEQLVNGVRPGLGPLTAYLTAFARSLPALHQLLPEYACVEHGGGLAKLTEVAVPKLSAKRVADALRFHEQLREAEARRPASLAATHAIVGISQPTATTARIADGRVECLDTYGGEGELFGDATVPLVAACRADVTLDSNTLRRVADRHGNLQRNPAALDELEGVLTARPIHVRAAGAVELRLDAPELVLAGEPLPVSVTATKDPRVALQIALFDEAGRLIESRVPRGSGGTVRTEIDDLAPGAYTLEARGLGPHVAAVSGTVLVWPAD